MKRIGILFGIEQSFPDALAEKINSLGGYKVSAELMKIGAVSMEQLYQYDLIFDRVSMEVPYFRTLLKNAVIRGVTVVNNPFWGCADDNFLNASISNLLGIPTPRTIALPSKDHPSGCSSESMRNLIFPLNWDEVFEYIGFPAYIKPNLGNGHYSSYKVYNPQEFFSAYDLTGSSVMILQEFIDYEDYFRCFVVGQKEIRIMRYDPMKPPHLRYTKDFLNIDKKLKSRIESISLQLCRALDFDFNAVEIAVRESVPYPIEFMHVRPNAEKAFLHEDNFEWLVEQAALMLLRHAETKMDKPSGFHWAELLKYSQSPKQ